MKKYVAFLFALSALTTCVPAKAPPANSNPDCVGVCARKRAMGCASGKDTLGGVTCEMVCTGVQTSMVVQWDLVCRAKAPTCEAMDACGLVKP